MIPCAYLRYYYMKDDLLRQELAEAGGEGTAGKWLSSWKKSCLTSTATRTWQSNRRRWKARRPVLFRGGLRADECIYNDKRIIMHVNTRNNGAINGLPDDCAVESAR